MNITPQDVTTQPISDDQLDQAAGGLSIVGVDYAFTATQTARS